MHQTVLLRGQDPLLSIERCTVCCIKYHCAYCKLGFNHLHELQNHEGFYRFFHTARELKQESSMKTALFAAAGVGLAGLTFLLVR